MSTKPELGKTGQQKKWLFQKTTNEQQAQHGQLPHPLHNNKKTITKE